MQDKTSYRRLVVFIVSLAALFAAEIGFDMSPEFQNNIVYLALAAIGGYSLEDLARAVFKQIRTDLPEDIEEIVGILETTGDGGAVG